MDHSGHDHSTHMDHSGHGDMHSGHPGMGEGAPRCSMNMLFTWNTENLCIVFRQWHIHSTFSLVVSLLAIVALAAGYEALREGIRQYEAWTNKRVETTPRKLFILTSPFCVSGSLKPLCFSLIRYILLSLPWLAKSSHPNMSQGYMALNTHKHRMPTTSTMRLVSYRIAKMTIYLSWRPSRTVSR